MTYNYLLQLVSFLLQSKNEFLFAIHNNHLQKTIFQADIIFNCPVLQFHGGFYSLRQYYWAARRDPDVNAFRNYFWRNEKNELMGVCFCKLGQTIEKPEPVSSNELLDPCLISCYKLCQLFQTQIVICG